MMNNSDENNNAVWIDALTERIGHFGLGKWLFELGIWLKVPSLLPPAEAERFCIVSARAITVMLHYPAWETKVAVDPDNWVLYEVLIDGTLPMPFGLDSKHETSTSVAAKLSDDISVGRHSAETGEGSRITYFLSDLRVATITFHTSGIGIKQMKISRLFSWPDWRHSSEDH